MEGNLKWSKISSLYVSVDNMSWISLCEAALETLTLGLVNLPTKFLNRFCFSILLRLLLSLLLVDRSLPRLFSPASFHLIMPGYSSLWKATLFSIDLFWLPLCEVLQWLSARKLSQHSSPSVWRLSHGYFVSFFKINNCYWCYVQYFQFFEKYTLKFSLTINHNLSKLSVINCN